MPTYDYLCETCGHQFEHFQSMSSERLTECPLEDRQGSVKRLIGTGAGIVFKGSGFYETDYKRKAAPDKESSSSASESKTDKANSSTQSTNSPKESSSSQS